MRNFRSTLVLAVLVVGLFVYLFFFDRHHRGTEQAEQARTQVFLDAAADKIDSLKITDAEGSLVLQKKEGQWTITAPVVTEADPNAVKEVLDELHFLTARRVISFSEIPEGTKTIKSWELLPGNVVIEFSGPGFSKVLRFGRKTAVSDLLYARATDNKGDEADAPVLLFPTAMREMLDRKLTDLRSHIALTVDPAHIAQFGLRLASAGSGAVPEYALSRQGTAWKLEKPLNAAADTQRVVAWLASLGGLHIHQFITDDASDLGPYGLNAPTAQFWVKGETAKAPVTLLIGQAVPPQVKGQASEVYAKRLDGKSVFTLSLLDVEKLETDLPATRDRKVIPFVTAQAAAIHAEQSFDPAKPRLFDIVKKGDKWESPGPASSLTIDRSALLSLLDDLSTLEAVQIVSDTTSDLKPYGLDHPAATLTVTLAPPATEKSVTLLLGKTAKVQDKSILYAKNADLPFIYGINPEFLKKWPGQPWTWLDLNVSPITSDQIGSLTLISRKGDSLRLTRNEGVFTSDRVGGMIDFTAASGKWNVMGHLHAVQWLGPVQPSYGLNKPDKVLVTPLASATGAVPFTLLIGAPVSGGYAAQLQGAPYAFVLPDEDFKKLNASPFMSGGVSVQVPPKP